MWLDSRRQLQYVYYTDMELMEELIGNNYIYLLNNGIDFKVFRSYTLIVFKEKKDIEEQIHCINRLVHRTSQ